MKEQIWGLILPLTLDPDPTPADDSTYGGNNMDPATRSINTVRGEAMHALVRYGLWVARNTATDEKFCFDDAPEMRETLDCHLNSKNDPSLAIRSIYGEFYPWLNLLDTEWAQEAKSRIFSNDEFGLGDAAWDAYIKFCPPYDDILKVMPDIYTKHVKKLSSIRNNDDKEQIPRSLVEHLITFYWRSKLELDGEILSTFYRCAPLKLRKYALEFSGQSLNNTLDLDKNIEERLKRLHEWRQSLVMEGGEQEELEGFYWWVGVAVIDKNWILTKFHELLQAQDKFDNLDLAASKLGDYLDVDPVKVLDCMDMILNKLNTQGGYFGWNDTAQDETFA